MKKEYRNDDKVKQLLSFYAAKAKDRSGGQFYRVVHKAQLLGTYWGRDELELRRHLNTELSEKVVKDGFAIEPLSIS